nr:patatin-like phospholipase family protein [Deltaproteobacteria bacterium]
MATGIAGAMGYDLVLSSGFLAFARHTGFLAAVEELGLPVDAVCGTSSGALVGALWTSGLPALDILALVASRRPIAWAAPH